MRRKLLLLLCSLFAIEGWTNSKNIRLTRINVRSNPIGIPVQPPSESCAFLSNIINISFDRIENYATVTVMDKITGEIVHSKTYLNAKDIIINMSACDKGEYTIHITLSDRSLEGTFNV